MTSPVIFEIIQGDSFEYDFSQSTYRELDQNWSGSWSIIHKSEFGKNTITPLASGNLSVSEDKKRFELRILPSDTEDIPTGAIYMLIVEVTNDEIGFKKEVLQTGINIKPQGIRA